MKKRNSHSKLVMCIDNEGYSPDLELRKIYRVVRDPDAERHREIRVIDESGEDYIFPASCFVSVAIPRAAERRRAARALAVSG
jgi:hypothetical protein